VAERAYGYTLWRRRPGNLLGDKAAGSGSWFFDLADKDAVTGLLDALIDRHGKENDERDGYWLEILDPVTGERVRQIVPLEPAVNGSAAFSLQEVSDEALVRELARRLANR
jgi:hypothetical protein